MIDAKQELRNRANDRDRPDRKSLLREAKLTPQHPGSAERGGHSHVFQPRDRYGCCKKCGDEVLT